MKRTRVKICGITRPEDALAAVTAGADAVGLVFWEPSPRAVTVSQAIDICQDLPAFVSVVALTVNADQQLVDKILKDVPVTCLQFHGDETATFCEQFGASYIKALRMKPELSLAEMSESFKGASGLLLDAYKKGVPGGTGERFDWQLIPQDFRSQIILAGGLTADNVEGAVTTVRPYAVDVSGGVELAPGIKDPAKVSGFINAVLRADNTG